MIDIVCVAYANYKLILKTINHHLALSPEFRILVCDNTPAAYRNKHFLKSMQSSRVKFFDFQDKSDHDGENHGAALDFLISQSETEIVSTIDHDFYWLRPDVYEWVNDAFDAGYKAIGAAGWYPPSQPDWQGSVDNNHPERRGELAPVCWGQFVLRELAAEHTFVTARTEGPWGYETGWRLRKFLIDNKVKTITIPGFQYESQKDLLACYFGTKRVPVGLHLLKGISRDYDKQRLLIEDLIETGRGQWLED